MAASNQLPTLSALVTAAMLAATGPVIPLPPGPCHRAPSRSGPDATAGA